MSRRVAVCALAAGVGIALSGCEAAFDVDVRTQTDGRGVVAVTANLDRDGAEQLRIVGASLRTDDLKAAGWIVTGPTTRANGGVSYRLSKPVDSAEQATAALTSLGPAFSSLRVERNHSLSRTTYAVRGSVDLRAGIESFGSEVLRTRLGSSSPLGVSPAEIEAQIGRPVSDALHFRVHADVPGAVAKVWETPLGESTPVEVVGEIRHYAVIVPLAVGLAAAVLCAALLIAQSRVRARQRQRRRSAPRRG